jgi:hypothetical protein
VGGVVGGGAEHLVRGERVEAGEGGRGWRRGRPSRSARAAVARGRRCSWLRQAGVRQLARTGRATLCSGRGCRVPCCWASHAPEWPREFRRRARRYAGAEPLAHRRSSSSSWISRSGERQGADGAMPAPGAHGPVASRMAAASVRWA